MWEVSEDEDHMGRLAVLLAAWVLCLGPPAAAVAQGGPQATAHSLLDGMPLLAASETSCSNGGTIAEKIARPWTLATSGSSSS